MLALKKNELFSHKKGIQEESLYDMTLEDKSLSTFLCYIAPMSIEKA